MRRSDWRDIDAKHDAHQDRLLAEARGQRIANPAAWESTARWRYRRENTRKHWRDSGALALFIEGGMTDLFGRRPVLHGNEYREHIRQQRRKLAAKRKAERG